MRNTEIKISSKSLLHESYTYYTALLQTNTLRNIQYYEGLYKDKHLNSKEEHLWRVIGAFKEEWQNSACQLFLSIFYLGKKIFKSNLIRLIEYRI